MRRRAKFLHLMYLARKIELWDSMPSGSQISASFTSAKVLTAIVETFISTGEPVGSRTLSRARIVRDLETRRRFATLWLTCRMRDFLEQRTYVRPGRVPTTDAYRYYVEQITENGNSLRKMKI